MISPAVPTAPSATTKNATPKDHPTPGPGAAAARSKKVTSNNNVRKLTATSQAYVPTPPMMDPPPAMPQHYPVHHRSGAPHAHAHPQQYQQQYPHAHYQQQYQQHQYPHVPYPAPLMYAMPPHPHQPQQLHQEPVLTSQQPSIDPALEAALVQEIDRLFSLENLAKDYAMAKHMRSGTVPLDCLITFPGIKKLSTERQVLLRAAARSQVVALSQHDKRIGRRDHATGGDLGWRTIELKDLSKDSTEATVQGLVGKYGDLAFLEVSGTTESEATAAGSRKSMHCSALVEFVEATAALKAMEGLLSGQNWRAGFRASFLNGFSVLQVARQLGVNVDSEDAAKEGGNNRSNGSTASSSSGMGSDAGLGSSVPQASLVLPPTIPEGEHTGVIMEVDGQGQGVLKREGKRRTIISFTVPEGLVLVAGDRVAFHVKHVENKAVVQNLTKAEPGSAPPKSGTALNSGSGGGGGKNGMIGPSSHRMAKGPDASLGFKMPRTKPPAELAELVQAMKQLKGSGSSVSAGPK